MALAVRELVRTRWVRINTGMSASRPILQTGLSQTRFVPMAWVSGDYPQTEVLGERIEIPVVVQQLIPALDAAGCNHRIDGLADRYALPAQVAKILRRLN